MAMTTMTCLAPACQGSSQVEQVLKPFPEHSCICATVPCCTTYSSTQHCLHTAPAPCSGSGSRCPCRQQKGMAQVGRDVGGLST